MSEEIKYLTVDPAAVRPSPTNPRRHFDETGLEELTRSVREVGVLQPVLVRPIAADTEQGIARLEEPAEDNGGRWRVWNPLGTCIYQGDDEARARALVKQWGGADYEVIAGERRWRAAQAAGLKALPVIVRQLTDDQVLEVQFIENLQRQDITAMEEAEGFRRLIDTGRWTPAKLSQRLGKGKAWIYGRLKLLELDDAQRDAVRSGQVQATVAEMVARLPVDCREEAWKVVSHGNRWWDEGQMQETQLSFRQAKAALRDRFYVNMEEAAWYPDHDNGELHANGKTSCGKCPNREGAWCTLKSCFEAKNRRHVDLTLERHAAAGGEVIDPDPEDPADGFYSVPDGFMPLEQHLYGTNDAGEGLDVSVAELDRTGKFPRVLWRVCPRGGRHAIEPLVREEAVRAEAEALGMHFPALYPDEDATDGDNEAATEEAWKPSMREVHDRRQLELLLAVRGSEVSEVVWLLVALAGEDPELFLGSIAEQWPDWPCSKAFLVFQEEQGEDRRTEIGDLLPIFELVAKLPAMRLRQVAALALCDTHEAATAAELAGTDLEQLEKEARDGLRKEHEQAEARKKAADAA